MIEYKTVKDVPQPGYSDNITENGELQKLGEEGWDLIAVFSQSEMSREWIFKRAGEEPKKRGRPAGSKNKAKDAS